MVAKLDSKRVNGKASCQPIQEELNDNPYAKIYKGQWVDDVQSYHVVHRIASYPDVHGIFSAIMDFCFSRDTNIRIDTHRDNKIMQHNLLKHGFTYCGIIYLLSGDERLAYQRIK